MRGNKLDEKEIGREIFKRAEKIISVIKKIEEKKRSPEKWHTIAVDNLEISPLEKGHIGIRFREKEEGIIVERNGTIVGYCEVSIEGWKEAISRKVNEEEITNYFEELKTIVKI